MLWVMVMQWKSLNIYLKDPVYVWILLDRDCQSNKILKQFRNNADLVEYTTILDRVITDISK